MTDRVRFQSCVSRRTGGRPVVCARRSDHVQHASPSVSSHKVRQCRLSYRGRDFHFVSYEGHPANERRGETAMPAMWYLMGPAKRWPVMEHNPDQPDEEVEKGLLKWLSTQELGLPRREA